ncbi:SusC/RagA family TonB-linked outer membrane protein [Pedobacter yulinensis]|uniref:SusC/RagA family TonB-linked outer membrane protein n=1 Tax=Pedobacter yulinensis TaxID=2126353 RepID=A0A2T3HRE8_9SPHI|nr:SusC/RagA family TonB-linked outer membrane protein [Pedobacter yulinensis]PST84973.1 SusC/RagA family TonB-linked outer membrane protein [Pedobacter yulinensis]
MRTLLIFLMLWSSVAMAQSRRLYVLDSLTNRPIAGAVVRIQGQTLHTDSAGAAALFSFTGQAGITHISYHPLQVFIAKSESMTVRLMPVAHTLEEVPVYTGYQQTQRGRVTGSAVSVDRELLNRRVSPDLLSRLEDVTSGLAFNRRTTSSPFNVRGQSTLFGNARPLIVIDHFPYEGSLDNINPNDIETVTVLRDAAAASIWGARAGNGVIVITTRKGHADGKLNVSLNTNVTTADKPDLFYQSRMTVNDYIETEKVLFARGFYRNAETSPNQMALSPVVELLIAARDGRMSSADAMVAIDGLKAFDLRAEQDRWMNRRTFNTQTSLSLSGSQGRQQYFISGGFDGTQASLKGNSNKRYTFSGNHTYSFPSDKLRIETGVFYSQIRAGAAAVGLANLQPYSRLADDQGNPLAVTNVLRRSFEENSRLKGLEDWRFLPLQELADAASMRNTVDYRINLGAVYKLLPGLQAEVRYSYGQTFDELSELRNASSYFARNLVNTYSTINSDGSITRAIPKGGIRDLTRTKTTSGNIRGQLNYSRTFASNHVLDVLAGAEAKELIVMGSRNRMYGYREDLGTGGVVNYTGNYKSFINPASTLSVPYVDFESNKTDRYLSYYSLANYAFKNRYFFSVSARLDQSNLVGVKTNQKGVPLYSFGASWRLSSEKFYDLNALPHLQLRASYGYNGNISKTYSGLITLSTNNGADSPTKLPYSTIENPPNPGLRWERVRVINAGLEFATAARRLSGNIEIYFKKNTDLLGVAPFPPTSGISIFKGNVGTSKNYGMDVSLTSQNLTGAFQWNSTLLFSLSRDKVLDYISNFTVGSGSMSPRKGFSLYALGAHRWAGLNPETGDPLGFLNGEVSQNYNQIISKATAENTVYFGSGLPTVFGAFRNDFSYRRLSLSVNISYRLGYFYHRESVIYGNNMGLGTHGDFASRWQRPGDERYTQIPSAPPANVSGRDEFYRYSEALVEKGDHIRLQDVQLRYQLDRSVASWLPVGALRIYGYMNNLGVLWVANKQGVDPDYRTGPPPRSIAFGIQADF